MGEKMGTWDSGPFDNDTAADWCGDFEKATPEQRPALIRQALVSAADELEYLDSDIACEAIAAAAIVVSQLPGEEPITSPYAPEFLTEGGRIEIPQDLIPLAARALTRVLADDSEWRDLWEEAAEPDAFDNVRQMIEALESSTE